MSSGGMDWAYRMIAAHTFDGMEIAVVLHLGWRDHPDFRSDRGIARALQKDRKNISRVTAKLAERGVIVRRSGQWVACETVAIVEEKAGALRPAEPDEKPGRGHQDPGVIRTPQEGSSGPRKRGHQDPAKRRENLRKGETRFRTSQNAPVARPMGGGSALSTSLSSFQVTRLLAGQSIQIDGKPCLPGSATFESLRQALRAQDALKRGVVNAHVA